MDTRERILSTASRLFYTQGYNNTGINQVIAEAAVAKASFYQYFPSKENLLVEYLKTTSTESNTALHLIANSRNTPKEKVLAIFDLLIKNVKKQDFIGCNFLNIIAEIPENSKAVNELVKKQKNEIRKIFHKILEPAGKSHLADEMYILFDAALATSKVYKETWPIKTCKQMAEKLL